MVTAKQVIAGWALLAGALAGCEPPPLSDNGVVGVFGGVGLGSGEFSYPRAIAAGPDGALFVVDKAARVQRFDAEGTFECAWRMPDKQAGKPVGLTVHPDGRIFVADTHYHRVLVFDRDGSPLDRFGEKGNGPGQFQLPTDVAVDGEGFIYVSEYNGNDRITKWSPDLGYVAAIGEEEVAGHRLARPAAIDIDAQQTLWVADACNHRIVRFSLDGRVLEVFGEMGTEPGQLRYPYDITVTPDDTLLVCEYGNSRLQWFDKQGHSLGTWGGAGRELGRLWQPWGATVGANRRVYVVDSYNSRVQIVKP
ncbi:MAG: 6-bladed beta-propeller [Planctomycetota bacterium]|jgi:DNA-binding beta-propeller fold protein YncE